MEEVEKKKLFGTDGIRGLANRYPLCNEVAIKVGAATAQILLKRNGSKKRTTYPRPRVVLGKDTRISSYMLEQALASGISSMGADVLLLGPLPTPGVAFLVQSMRADAGIMVSASHNLYEDNGIKIFDHSGFKLPDYLERKIEDQVLSSLKQSLGESEKKPTGTKIGRAIRIDDALGRYLTSLKSTLPSNFHLDNVPIVVDCANGAAYKVAPLLFKELGAKVIECGVSPNGSNINLKSGALHPEVASQAVKKSQAFIGISLDGDGDRVILCDEKGETVDGDQIMGICALEMKRQGKLRGNKVVATHMSNIGLEQVLRKNGIELIRVAVGDRYVTEYMRANHCNFGGEQSGHIIFHDLAVTGDGLLAALKIIEIMVQTNTSLSELKSKILLLPQVRQDIRIREKIPLEKLPKVQRLIQSIENDLKGRILVRYSGTEPLVRIMLEGKDREELARGCAHLAKAFAESIGEA